MVYHISIKGKIDPDWLRRWGTVEILTTEQEDGSVITTIKADCIDQPALFGILDWIRDLNISLVSLTEENYAIGINERKESLQ